MSAPVASKIRNPSRPSMATSAKSHGFDDWTGRSEQGLELQVGESQSWRFRGDRGPADVLGG
jgi:hypothetical protein